MTPNELRDQVDTLVLVMLENRSFDHVLGHLSLRGIGDRTDVHGLICLDDPDYANPSKSGTLIQPFLAEDGPLPSDLPHERPSVEQQLAASTLAGGFTMTGFVQSYEDFVGSTGSSRPPPMGILTPHDLPISHFLAQEFMICDRWHAPLPTSTQPNRLMAFGGDTLIDNTRSGLLPNQDLLFDWLNRHQVTWRVYSAGISFFMLFSKLWGSLLTGHFRPLSELEHDFRTEPSSSFPRVIIVEPDYGDAPIHLSGHPSDNHPPLPVSFGEGFLRTVYQAIISNLDRWAKTVMVVNYDEHGGFYDHVAPLRVSYAPPPGAQFNRPFSSTGPRIPAWVVSPFTRGGKVSHAPLDHTSVLQLVADRFDPSGTPYSASVEARRAAGIASLAVTLGSAIQTEAPRVMPAFAAPHLERALPSVVGPGVVPPAQRDAFASAIQGFANYGGAQALEKYPEIGRWLANQRP